MITSKMILGCISDGVFTIDPDGRILSFNKAAEAITGFSEEEVLGKPCMGIFRTDLCQTLCPLKLCLKTKDTVSNFEITITRRSGERIPISVNTAVLRDSAGNVLGGVETFRNVSEVITLREQLSRIARLRSLALVAAGVAHEIRNPLACIKTTLEHACQNVTADFPYREELDDSLVEVSRADEIIRKLLDFARPEKPARAEVDINQLTESVVGHVAVQCRRSKIRVEWRLTPNLPRFDTDPGQLRTALLNILVNALEAMPDGGTLLIQTTGEVEAPSVSGKHAARPRRAEDWKSINVIVQDSGVGIRREDLPHVFEPFFTSKHGGIGLGLSLAHQAIERHGGIVNIESEPGAGTRVCIRLPLFTSESR